MALFLLLFSALYTFAAGFDASVACSQLRQAISDWHARFSGEIPEDPGYVYCHERCTTIRGHGQLKRSCYEATICARFSDLRCATCYAMALCDNVSFSTFCDALERCRDSEVYQVFMAADSSHKTKKSARKIQKLQDKTQALQYMEEPARPLLQAGASFQTLPWTQKAARKERDSVHGIYLNKTSWLQLWYMGRQVFIKNLCWRSPNYPEASQYLTFTTCAWNMHSDAIHVKLSHVNSQQDLLQRISKLTPNNPYVLHHIEKQDFLEYAYAWVPTLYNPEVNFTWARLVLQALPTTPNLRYLADIIDKAEKIFSSIEMRRQCRDSAQDLCQTLVDSTWDFFHKLQAPISFNKWRVCVDVLKELPLVAGYLSVEPKSFEKIFSFRAHHRIYPEAPISQSKYCDQTHLQPFLRKRVELMEKVFESIERINRDALKKALDQTEEEEVESEDTIDDGDMLSARRREADRRRHERAINKTRSINERFFDPLRQVLDECYSTPASSFPCLLRQHVTLQALLKQRCKILWAMASPKPPHADFWILYDTCTNAEKIYLHTRAKNASDRKRLNLFTFAKFDSLKDLERISCALCEDHNGNPGAIPRDT